MSVICTGPPKRKQGKKNVRCSVLTHEYFTCSRTHAFSALVRLNGRWLNAHTAAADVGIDASDEILLMIIMRDVHVFDVHRPA